MRLRDSVMVTDSVSELRLGSVPNKIHARGPVGLDGLVTYKYMIVGAGHVVSSYVGKSAKAFNHRNLEKHWDP